MVPRHELNPRPVNCKSVALPIVPPHHLICSVCFFTDIEGNDEAVLSMIMHSHGGVRRANTLTGSTATEPKAEDYTPDGVLMLFFWTAYI